MKSKRIIVIAAILILSIVFLINILKKDLWDVVYSFDPDTPKEMIYETIGYKWDSIRETVSEGMNQIVFMNNGKVVCYLYGYPENNGYGIYFINKGNMGLTSTSTLTLEDDLTFHILRSDDIIYLKN